MDDDFIESEVLEGEVEPSILSVGGNPVESGLGSGVFGGVATSLARAPAANSAISVLIRR